MRLLAIVMLLGVTAAAYLYPRDLGAVLVYAFVATVLLGIVGTVLQGSD